MHDIECNRFIGKFDTGEEYRDIIGFPYYLVTSHGRVLNAKTGKFLLPDIGEKGYQRVTLFNSGNRSRFLVHRLVSFAFLTEIEGKDQVNHIDHNTSNNRLENLEWVDAKENQEKSLARYITRGQGQSSNLANITEEHVDAIRCLLSNHFSTHKISRVLGISRSCVQKIKDGKSWRFYNAV